MSQSGQSSVSPDSFRSHERLHPRHTVVSLQGPLLPAQLPKPTASPALSMISQVLLFTISSLTSPEAGEVAKRLEAITDDASSSGTGGGEEAGAAAAAAWGGLLSSPLLIIITELLIIIRSALEPGPQRRAPRPSHTGWRRVRPRKQPGRPERRRHRHSGRRRRHGSRHLRRRRMAPPAGTPRLGRAPGLQQRWSPAGFGARSGR